MEENREKYYSEDKGMASDLILFCSLEGETERERRRKD